MEVNVSELRKQRRPLWMTDLGVESSADILGGGGDLYSDRLAIDWDRNTGVEFTEDELTMMYLQGREEDYIS